MAIKRRQHQRGRKINDCYPASPTGARPINRAANLATKLHRAARAEKAKEAAAA